MGNSSAHHSLPWDLYNFTLFSVTCRVRCSDPVESSSNIIIEMYDTYIKLLNIKLGQMSGSGTNDITQLLLFP